MKTMTVDTGYFTMTMYASGGETRVEVAFSNLENGYTGGERMLDEMAAQMLEAHEYMDKMSGCFEEEKGSD